MTNTTTALASASVMAACDMASDLLGWSYWVTVPIALLSAYCLAKALSRIVLGADHGRKQD